MSHNGNWFAVSRLIFDHPIVGIHDRAFTELEAWLWLLGEAAFEPVKVNNKGAIIVLDVGQIMHARTYLAKRWEWTEDKVRWFLKRLQNDAMIARFCTQQTARQRANQIQIITICNYGQYQFSQANQQPAEPPSQHPASTQPTPSQHPQDNNLTPKQEDSPPSPPLTRRGRTRTDAAKAKADRIAQSKQDIEQAFAIYNEAATTFGFYHASITPARANRMAQRLGDLGGLNNFRLALWEACKDDWLMGRRAPRPGEKPFHLDIDRLMQTEGRMGDVLASMLDRAKSPGRNSPSTESGLRPDWWIDSEKSARVLPAEWWRNVIKRYANGAWPVQFLGPGPWEPERCLVPPQVKTELQLAEKYPSADGRCAVQH